MPLRTVIFILVLAAGAHLHGAETVPATPPLPPSPVEQFRQWLELPADEREKQISEWPEANQKVLRAKLDAYAELPAEERERRLAMLDLRHYMDPLLTEPPSPEREARVSTIPEEYRQTVRERLAQWDQLPRELKERMIQNELALQYLTRIRRKTPPEQSLQQFDASIGQNLKPKLERWQTIPAQERLSLSLRLNRFFDLPREERQKTLRTLSESEQQEIQRSLEALNRMPPEQRHACIQSFARLAAMNPTEQLLFLQNAARWQAMTPQERETWKNLVLNLPPLPPDSPPLPAPQPATASTNPAG